MDSLLQTKEWAAFRETQGWISHEFEGISISEKKLPFGKNFLYVPEIGFEKIEKNLENITKNIKNSNTIFLRVEILNKNSAEIADFFAEHSFVKAFEEIQPEWRQIIDISMPEAEILAQMKEKGRYNIKIAQKHSVKVESSNDIEAFYKLYQETGKRDHFSVRPKGYFEKMFEILLSKNYVELLAAKYNNTIIAAEIVSFYGDTASYLYGASSNDFRNVMAPYLLHFEAILRAKARGMKYYDLLAVNPLDQENHKFAGIGRYKRQFGGETVNIAGSYDFIYKPFWYWLFKKGEKYRRR